MKIADIRKVLIKQSIIVLVIVGVLVGGIFYLESLDEECDRNINSLKAEADGIIKQVADMSLEYNNVVSSMAAYNEIKQKQDKKMLMINTSALRDEINKVREKNHLSDLDVKMEGAKPLSGDKYKRSTAFIESNNINISFNALTDIDVLELINNLEHAFIGIKFTGLKLTLSKNVDNAMLIAIKDTGFSPIINAKLAFTLFGMRNVTVDDNELTSKEGAPAPVPDNDGRKLIRLRPR